MKLVANFAVQNSLIVPVALAVNEPPPPNVREQNWFLQLTGVCIPNLKGTGADWLRETLAFFPDLLAALHFAISSHAIPRPPGTEGDQYVIAFQVLQSTVFAAISSSLAVNTPVNAGFAVDSWRHGPFLLGHDSVSGQPYANLFNGIEVDVAVRNNNSVIHRVSYQITLIGKIRFVAKVIL